MKDAKEKFTIHISGQGVKISGAGGECLELTAVEALMVLDILRGEENQLKVMAEASSPLPMKITLKRKDKL
jgi:hypothetical protein